MFGVPGNIPQMMVEYYFTMVESVTTHQTQQIQEIQGEIYQT